MDFNIRLGLGIRTITTVEGNQKLRPICRNRGNFTGYNRFLNGFYGLTDIPTIFQEKIYQTLEINHPVWLDDIILVTIDSKEEHMKELFDLLIKLEKAG